MKTFEPTECQHCPEMRTARKLIPSCKGFECESSPGSLLILFLCAYSTAYSTSLKEGTSTDRLLCARHLRTSFPLGVMIHLWNGITLPIFRGGPRGLRRKQGSRFWKTDGIRALPSPSRPWLYPRSTQQDDGRSDSILGPPNLISSACGHEQHDTLVELSENSRQP